MTWNYLRKTHSTPKTSPPLREFPAKISALSALHLGIAAYDAYAPLVRHENKATFEAHQSHFCHLEAFDYYSITNEILSRPC